MSSEIPNNALIIAISGPSSSGKTTVARLLRDIFPGTFILHQDDFYLPDAQIPLLPASSSAPERDLLQNWDCVEALDIPSFVSTLAHIRTTGLLPPNSSSKEDKNAVGSCPVDERVVDELHWKASRWQFEDVPPIAIVDGFLLLGKSVKDDLKGDLFDARMFLRCGFETMKQRRERRKGYVTLEGFWEDPKGYVDEVVWPEYVKEHEYLFKGGDVDGGDIDSEVARELGIEYVPKEFEGDMTATLRWAFETVERALEERIRRHE